MRSETPVSEVAFWNTLQWITLFWYDCAAIDVAARFALLFYITLVPYFGGRFRSCRVCRGVCFLRLARFHAERMAASQHLMLALKECYGYLALVGVALTALALAWRYRTVLRRFVPRVVAVARWVRSPHRMPDPMLSGSK